MIFRCILPDWKSTKAPHLPKVVEGEFTPEELQALNDSSYNIYFLPNHPSAYDPNTTVSGSHIDVFRYVFVDCDLKDGKYADKQEFIAFVQQFPLAPSLLVDSGNGVHAYWSITDLDAKIFLRLQRRLAKYFQSDEAVSKIYQLMRAPGYNNTKTEGNPKPCQALDDAGGEYSAEQLDKVLPLLTPADEQYCDRHYNSTYKILTEDSQVDDKIPPKFNKLLAECKEAKDIWIGNVEDRSAGDYRLGHLMMANGFSRNEAASVLVNAAKALQRAPIHRISYAMGIIDKIWTFEESADKDNLDLSSSVKDILSRTGDTLKGTRFSCWRYLDATQHGFRLGQVVGLVAGSGVGKTAMALNMFRGFVQSNPEYHHFFIPLEQPANEIAERWRSLCGKETHLHDKVHVISNYDDKGAFRNLSLEDIKAYILRFQEVKGIKVGCVVIDHIGALKKKGKNGENQDLMDICHTMKAVAQEINCMLVMQSQAPREKAGIGDLELNKDAAYGTVFFESYCDYLITIWQPLKRVYSQDGCPTVTAFKFCKIRHKNVRKDELQEDVCYRLHFNPDTGQYRELTQREEQSFEFFNKQALDLRTRDRKTDLVPYQSIGWTTEEEKISGTSQN